MKRLIGLILVGTVTFLALAMAQEWEFFASSWFGAPRPTPVLAVDQEQEALASVRTTLALMQHLYGSGGDPRFAERMPAADPVITDMLEDIEYLKRNQRIQLLDLRRFEPTGIEQLGPETLELRTRELWQVHYRRLDGEPLAEPMRVEVTHGRYLLQRSGQNWQLADWDIEPDPAPPGDAP